MFYSDVTYSFRTKDQDATMHLLVEYALSKGTLTGIIPLTLETLTMFPFDFIKCGSVISDNLSGERKFTSCVLSKTSMVASKAGCILIVPALLT